jgi:hypothetical protein
MRQDLVVTHLLARVEADVRSVGAPHQALRQRLARRAVLAVERLHYLVRSEAHLSAG